MDIEYPEFHALKQLKEECLGMARLRAMDADEMIQKKVGIAGGFSFGGFLDGIPWVGGRGYFINYDPQVKRGKEG